MLAANSHHLMHDSPVPFRDCVGGIIGVSGEYGLPANLAIVGDVFLKSCE